MLGPLTNVRSLFRGERTQPCFRQKAERRISGRQTSHTGRILYVSEKIRHHPSLKTNPIAYTLKTSLDRKQVFSMFSDKLTDSLLQICQARHLSYEAAAELCDISSRHFGDVVRKESSPTLTVFEKFCNAFDKTPNELLGYPHSDELRFRSPQPVTAAYCFHLPEHLAIYPVCPQCRCRLSREYQNYCSHCGQVFHGITLIMLKSLSLINPFPPRIHSNLCGSVFCPCSGRKQLKAHKNPHPTKNERRRT